MYSKIEFEKLINEILKNAGFNIKISLLLLEDQSAKKWYDQKYINFDTITENTIYGVVWDNIIQFNFKVGKIDNLLKTFITQFSRKYYYYDFVDGTLVKISNKKETTEKIIKNNKDRVYKGLFYTTLYGIGFWSIFSSKKDKDIAKNLHTYLKENNIPFKNELSDAGWVYRFIIKKGINTHNLLLSNFIDKI